MSINAMRWLDEAILADILHRSGHESYSYWLNELQKWEDAEVAEAVLIVYRNKDIEEYVLERLQHYRDLKPGDLT